MYYSIYKNIILTNHFPCIWWHSSKNYRQSQNKSNHILNPQKSYILVEKTNLQITNTSKGK